MWSANSKPKGKSNSTPAQLKKMKWSDSILLSHPVRDVRLLSRAPLQDWQTHVHDREQAACERGRREGERSLSEQLLKQRSDVAALQQGVLTSLSNAVPQVIRETEQMLIELALEAARKVVAGIPVTVELIEAVVREAVGQIEGSTEITVQLHPDDLALLRAHNSPALRESPEAGPVRFASSSEVTRGGALVQTRFGLIDARRETKLEQLKESLKA
jgi:flagellar biosynthesis/type III secretory pathway protein FliH